MGLIYILLILILTYSFCENIIDLPEKEKYIINNHNFSISAIFRLELRLFNYEYAYIKLKGNNGVFKSDILSYELSQQKTDNISLTVNISFFDKTADISSESYYYKIKPKIQYTNMRYIYFKCPEFEGESMEVINLSSSLIMNQIELKKYGTYTIRGSYDFIRKIFCLNLTSFNQNDEIYLEITVYEGQLVTPILNYKFFKSEPNESDNSLDSFVNYYHEASESSSQSYEGQYHKKEDYKKYYYKLENKQYKYLFFESPVYIGKKMEIKNAESSLEDYLLFIKIIIPILAILCLVSLSFLLYKKCKKMKECSNNKEALNYPGPIEYDPVDYPYYKK